MNNENHSSLMDYLGLTARAMGRTVVSLKDISVKQFGKLIDASKSWEGHLEKAQQFIKDHKDVILVSSAVAVTFVLTKKLSKKTPEEKPKTKKTTVLIQKTFASDQEDFEEPSLFTGKTAESSQKEEIARKCKAKILDRLEQSSEGQDEKIFFEMYKTYQHT